VGPALDGSDAEIDSALQAYARRHHEGLAAHEKFCSAYSTGKKFNPMEKLLFRGAARDRELAGRMAEMGGRWITPQQMLTPATLGRILRVNLTRGRRPIGLRRQQPSSVPVAG